MQTYFLGEPPTNVKQWIIDNYAQAYHADTWYKYANDTEWRTVSITGELTDSSIPNVIDVTTLEIGSAVTSIEGYTFANCTSLSNITIPDSVTSIESYAFCGCTGLTSIIIPDSVTRLGEDVFKFNANGELRNVIIGKGMKSLGREAFDGCVKLKSITLPDSITSIGIGAFNGSLELTLVTIFANGGNAQNVKQMMINANAGMWTTITWNMPS